MKNMSKLLHNGNNISNKCVELVKHYEGFFANAYLDPIGIPTIGYGTIRYEDGTKVQLGDTCTKSDALLWLSNEIDNNLHNLNGLELNQDQFDACMSFIYNCGAGNFNSSTLKKKIFHDPNDKTIGYEFSRWNKADGKVLPGLTARRKAEYTLYSTGKLIF